MSEFLIYFALIIGALFLVIWYIATIQQEKNSRSFAEITKDADPQAYADAPRLVGTDGSGMFAPKAFLVVANDYSSLILATEPKGHVSKQVLYPDDIIEASFQTVEGEKVTQITGKGALVTLGAGATLGIAGAIVGAATAGREEAKKNPNEPAKAVLEIVHAKAGGPRFTLELQDFSEKNLERTVGDWNARLKLFMSKKISD